MTLKNSKIIAAALSMGLVLSACGNDANKPAEEPAPAETETAETTETETETAETETAEAPAEEATETETAEVEDFDWTVVSREDGSGTRGAFIELTGLEEKDENDEKIDTTTLDAIIQNSTNGVMQTVSGDETAIGYISLGSLNDTVKAVKVDGVEATEENIENGSYGIARPFNLAYKEGELSELAQDFLDFTLSTEAQEITTEHGYVALKDTKNYEAKGLEGNITVAGSTSVTPLIEAMAEKYKELNPGAVVEIQSTGSSAGIEAVIDGAAQIAMASRELKDEELEVLTPVVIATDGIAVVVNTANPIEDLTLEQIKNIFNGTIVSSSELN